MPQYNLDLFVFNLMIIQAAKGLEGAEASDSTIGHRTNIGARLMAHTSVMKKASSVTLMAMAIESALNFVLEKESWWNTIHERSYWPLKFRYICLNRGVDIDEANKREKDIYQIFAVRNKLVHAKGNTRRTPFDHKKTNVPPDEHWDTITMRGIREWEKLMGLDSCRKNLYIAWDSVVWITGITLTTSSSLTIPEDDESAAYDVWNPNLEGKNDED